MTATSPGEKIQQIMVQWDGGVLNRGEVQSRLFDLALETNIDQVLVRLPEPWRDELFEHLRGWAESDSDEPIAVGGCIYSYEWESNPVKAEIMRREVEAERAAEREHFKKIKLPAIRAWWARRDGGGGANE
jgi:hypothetical protein